MNLDLTQGSILKNMLKFAFTIMIGNMLQQLYNIVDTLIIGRYLGENALAAVWSKRVCVQPFDYCFSVRFCKTAYAAFH